MSNLKWSIAGNIDGEDPNVLSEIKFNNITRFGGGINVNWNIFPFAYATFSFGNYFAFNGSGTDIDYSEDDRTIESYRLNFDSRKGELSMYQMSILFPIVQNGKTTVFLGGTSSFHHQKFYLNSEEFPKLNSSYSPIKSGYGLTAVLTFALPLHYTVNLETHALHNKYRASGNWNLIENFDHPISFRHKSSGFDVAAKLKTSKMIFKNLDVYVNFEYSFSEIGTGTDILYQNGGIQTITLFNGSFSNMTTVGLGCTLKFFYN